MIKFKNFIKVDNCWVYEINNSTRHAYWCEADKLDRMPIKLPLSTAKTITECLIMNGYNAHIVVCADVCCDNIENFANL